MGRDKNESGFFDPDAGYGGQPFGIPDNAPDHLRTKAVRLEYYPYTRNDKLVSTTLFRVGQHLLFPNAHAVLKDYVSKWVSEALANRFYYEDNFRNGHSIEIDLNGHKSAMVSYRMEWTDHRTQVQNRQMKAIPFELIKIANDRPGRIAYRRKDRHLVFAEAFTIPAQPDNNQEAEREMIVGIFPDYLLPGRKRQADPIVRDGKVVLERPGCLIHLANYDRFISKEEYETVSFIDNLLFFEDEISRKLARPVLEAVATIKQLDQNRNYRGPAPGSTRVEEPRSEQPGPDPTATATAEPAKPNGGALKVTLGEQLKNKGLPVPTIGNDAPLGEGAIDAGDDDNDASDDSDEHASSPSEMT